MAKTIVGELMDLYVKYGGKREDLKGTETTAEMIDAIEQIVGGNNNFVVTYSATMAEETPVYSADKTYAEIMAAIEAGKNVSAKIDMPISETVTMTMYLSLNASIAGEEGRLSFDAIFLADNVPNYCLINHSAEVITFEQVVLQTASA